MVSLSRARLQALESPGVEEPDRAVYEIACEGCGFEGPDGSFLVLPTEWREGADHHLERARRLWDEGGARKCPRCHARVTARGLQLHALLPSAGLDLVAVLDAGSSVLFAIGMDGDPEEVGAADPRLSEFGLDTRRRAAAGLAAMDQLEVARQLLDPVLLARPQDAGSRLLLASILEAQGRIEDAVSAIQEVASRAGDSPDGARAVGLALDRLATKSRDPELAEMAVDWLERAGLDSGEDPEASLAYGRLLLGLGRIDVARRHLEIAVQDEETSVDAARLLAALELRSGSAETAYRISAELRTMFPDDLEVLKLMAWSAARTGRSAESEDALRDLEKLAPGSPDIAMLRQLGADPSA